MKHAEGHDITQGSLVRSITHLAWPIALSQLLFMLPSLYEAGWLSRLGHQAQAAAGLAMSVRFTMISVLMALSGGSGAVVARYVGAGDRIEANLATLQGVILMIVASGSLGVVGVVLARPLMVLAGADQEVLPFAVRYARVLFAGLISMEMVPSLGGVLNAAGAPKIRLGMTLLSTGTLLATQPLLINRLGIEGAALALVVSNTVGMLWGLGVLVTGRAPIRIDLRRLRLDFPMMGRILRVALPGVIQRGTPNLTNSVLTRLIASYGAPTLAAWVVVRSVANVATIPGVGLAWAAPAMVGQNLGAEQPERASRSVRLIAWTAAVATACILGGLAVFAPQTIALFSNDPEILSIGTQLIRLLVVGYLAFTLNTVFDIAQAGAGDTVSPMLVNLVALWAVQIPLAYGLSRWAGLGALGIWLALDVGWAVQASLMFWRFRQGRWKRRRI